MEFEVGQGVLGKIRFVDGSMPDYDRPYLIVKITEAEVFLLNVSSVRGKEWKLALKSNYGLKQYRPPFIKPSFVKLDSLVRISKQDCQTMRLLYGGSCLNDNDLQTILRKLSTQ